MQGEHDVFMEKFPEGSYSHFYCFLSLQAARGTLQEGSVSENEPLFLLTVSSVIFLPSHTRLMLRHDYLELC